MTVREASLRCAWTLKTIAHEWRRKHDAYAAMGLTNVANDCKNKANLYWAEAHSWLRFAANH